MESEEGVLQGTPSVVVLGGVGDWGNWGTGVTNNLNSPLYSLLSYQQKAQIARHDTHCTERAHHPTTTLK
jgi:hypothetical protein